MHNPTIYRAMFRNLIVTAFGKEQTLKLRIELTMYQKCDSPEKWTYTPTLPTGRPHPDASSPVELARLIEENFVQRDSDWIEITPSDRIAAAAAKPLNVITMPRRRSA